jgi:hypothetical protein
MDENALNLSVYASVLDLSQWILQPITDYSRHALVNV